VDGYVQGRAGRTLIGPAATVKKMYRWGLAAGGVERTHVGADEKREPLADHAEL
jgi:hypothetical protein